MPLKLKLAAHESLIVNGAVMVNGGCRTTLIIRNFAQILREKDVLQEPDANTPTKRLYFIVQAMLMQPPPPPELLDSYRLAHTQLSSAYVRSENLELLREVDRLVGVGDCYKAMMKLHPLIEYEAGLLNVPRHEWRRAGQRDAVNGAQPRPEPQAAVFARPMPRPGHVPVHPPAHGTNGRMSELVGAR
jgi:flagellar biosynthesis repressor protein FlbT